MSEQDDRELKDEEITVSPNDQEKIDTDNEMSSPDAEITSMTESTVDDAGISESTESAADEAVVQDHMNDAVNEDAPQEHRDDAVNEDAVREHPGNTGDSRKSPSDGAYYSLEEAQRAAAYNQHKAREEAQRKAAEKEAAGPNAPLYAYQDRNQAYYAGQREGVPHWAKGEAGPQSDKKKSKGTTAAIIIACVLAGVLVVGVLAAACFCAYNAVNSGVIENIIEEGGLDNYIDGSEGSQSFDGSAGVSELPGDSQQIGGSPFSSDNEMSVEDVVTKCMPSMVAITCTTVEEVQSYFFFDEPTQQESTFSGTGVIVDETDDAYLIVTNNHVIDGAQNVSVTFADDSTFEATYVGRDTAEDLALISVDKSQLTQDTMDAVDVITLGTKESVSVGQSVVAIGNALGYGQSVSSGIISAIDRQVVVDGVAHTLFQTDAAINPGNSGGALLNLQGELIGINEVKYAQTQVEGMGYAIPVNTVEAFLSKETNRETREKVSDDEAAYLGVKVVTMQDAYVKQGYPAGVIITEVTEGGAAAGAGMQANDIITAIDGYSVTSSEELIDRLTYYKAGETVSFTILRYNENGNEKSFVPQSLDVTLGSRAEAEQSEAQQAESQSSDSEQSPLDNSNGDLFSRR